MTTTRIGQAIVVGVDASASALQAALWAAAEAAQRREPMRLVSAVDNTEFTYGAWLAPTQEYLDELDAGGRQVLADVADAIHRAHPDVDVTTDLHRAGPVASLIEESDGALMVVVGSRGMGGFRSMLVGSTAVTIAAHAHCPVAVVRGSAPDEAPRTDGPVIVGVDGSATSDNAVATAFDEASWRGAELVAVHTWTEPGVFNHPQPADEQAQDTREQEVLAERLAGWQEKYPDVTVSRFVSKGSPVDGLLDNAAGAQLLVVGSRGHGGFTSMLLGSTSQALVYHATCPTLVVRPAART